MINVVSTKEIEALDQAIDWVNTTLFMGQSREWAIRVAADATCKSGADFLRLVSVKWPGLIEMQDEQETKVVIKSVVDEKFLLNSSRSMFPYLLYQLFFGRNPTAKEVSEAVEADAKGERSLFIHEVVNGRNSNEPSANNDRCLLDAASSVKVLRAYRMGAETLLFREPAIIPESFFFSEAADGADAASGINCFEYSNQRRRIIKFPSMSLIGVVNGVKVKFHPGWVFYGPRVNLPAGRYVVEIDISVGDLSTLQLDVVSNFATQRHFVLDFHKNLKTSFEIEFAVPVRAVEIRLSNKSLNSDYLELRRVSLLRVQDFIIEEERPSCEQDPFQPAKAPTVVSAEAAAEPKTDKPLGDDRENGLPPLDEASKVCTSVQRNAKKKRLFSTLGKLFRRETAYDLIENTGEFDRAWYLQRYPDVRNSGIDPLRHYVDFGHKEGRLPNPHFDPLRYGGGDAKFQGGEDFPFFRYLKEKYGWSQ